MSAKPNLEAGRRYLENKITIPIDDLTWNDPPYQDASELTISSKGQRMTFPIDNLDLEDIQRRSTLEERAEQIVLDFQ